MGALEVLPLDGGSARWWPTELRGRLAVQPGAVFGELAYVGPGQPVRLGRLDLATGVTTVFASLPPLALTGLQVDGDDAYWFDASQMTLHRWSAAAGGSGTPWLSTPGETLTPIAIDEASLHVVTPSGRVDRLSRSDGGRTLGFAAVSSRVGRVALHGTQAWFTVLNDFIQGVYRAELGSALPPRDIRFIGGANGNGEVPGPVVLDGHAYWAWGDLVGATVERTGDDGGVEVVTSFDGGQVESLWRSDGSLFVVVAWGRQASPHRSLLRLGASACPTQ